VNKDDLILISVDDHICEPADMFDAHVPAKYKEFAPRVVEEPDGTIQWWYGEVKGRQLGLNAVAGKPREFFNVDPIRYEDMRPGCYDVHERVRDMNAGGQLAGLNFPNFTGFAGQVLNLGPDRGINEIMIKAYNDWHVDEWCATYPGRFIPCGILPLFDVDLAAQEVRRLADKGCHAVTFSENPEGLGMPSIYSGHWDPLFAVCNDVGTVLCTHIGSSSRAALVASDAPASVGMSISSMASTSTLMDIIWADFWFRFPNLRFSLTEGDIGWIPYFLERAEHVHARHSGWTMQTFPPDVDGPASIFKKHILCCFISDPVGVRLLQHGAIEHPDEDREVEYFNVDNVCWESDYPHSDSPWPNAPEYVERVLAPLPEPDVDKITHLNAMKHYQFDPFEVRDRKACTVAALRAESPDVQLTTFGGRKADERDVAAYRRLKQNARDRSAAAYGTTSR
jgi:predicted TIM-barrel fold metal-dependent hydrolase